MPRPTPAPLGSPTGSTPAAIRLATGALILALGIALTQCRLDRIINPRIADRLVVEPDSVRDSQHAGSSDSRERKLRIATADGATLRWSATKSTPWVTLTPSAGGAPDSLVVELHADTLSQVAHYDTIVFTSSDAPRDTVRVPIEFDVLPPAPELVLTPTAYVDSAFVGSAVARSFVLHIDNTGALPLTWNGSLDAGWLSLSKMTGGAPPLDSTTVTLTPGTLAAGTYAGAVTITATAGTTGSPGTVAVSFKIKPCAQPGVVADTLVSSTIALSDCGAPLRSGSQAKLYSVTASVGDTLSFRLTSAAFDPYLFLTDSLGALLQQNDDCPGFTGPSCILSYIVPAAGRYVVHATTAGVGSTGAFQLLVVRERAPTVPLALGQFRGDSATAIAAGAVTTQNVAVLKATVNDPNARDSVRLEVEMAPVSSPFGNAPTHQSLFYAAGQTAAVRVTGLTENVGYHWQGRTCDKTGRCSAWVSFGGNAESAPDFLVNAVAEDPTLDGVSLNQLNGTAQIPVGSGTGGGLGSTQTVTFRGVVADIDPGDVILLEVEAKTVGNAFNGTGTSRGNAVASGGTAFVAIPFQAPLLGSDAYHWRARACDQAGRCSAWISFGNNAESATDFSVP